MKHTLKISVLSLIFTLSFLHVSPIPLKAEGNDVPDEYTLEEVVVLSRHNIRAPLSTQGSALDIATPHEWTKWSSNASELSLRGGTQTDIIRSLEGKQRPGISIIEKPLAKP